MAAILAGCATSPPPPHGHPSGVHFLSSGAPHYPPEMERAGLTGFAELDCTITETGVTSDCVVKRASQPAFAASALDFVHHAHYSPAYRDGVAVAVPHHTFTIRFTLPARTFNQSALCDVQPSGSVRNCRPASTPVAEWPLVKMVLERVVATPRNAAGQAIDDPDRPVSVVVAVADLPLSQPMPALTGDMLATFVVACHRTTTASGAVQRHCSPAGQDARPDEPADTTRQKVEMTITGITPQATGDFSQ